MVVRLNLLDVGKGDCEAGEYRPTARNMLGFCSLLLLLCFIASIYELYELHRLKGKEDALIGDLRALEAESRQLDGELADIGKRGRLIGEELDFMLGDAGAVKMLSALEVCISNDIVVDKLEVNKNKLTISVITPREENLTPLNEALVSVGYALPRDVPLQAGAGESADMGDFAFTLSYSRLTAAEKGAYSPGSEER